MTTTDRLARLEAALAELDVTAERATAAEAADRIEAAAEAPAVGADLPFDGVSLPGSVRTDPTAADLEAARTGVTAADLAIASYGSVAIPSTAAGDEPIALYPERHVAIVRASDVVPDLGAAFDRLEARFEGGSDSVVLATGRSATADMGALVHGVHGPREVHVVVLTDR